jgi:hypothetical protein
MRHFTDEEIAEGRRETREAELEAGEPARKKLIDPRVADAAESLHARFCGCKSASCEGALARDIQSACEDLADGAA